MSVVTANASALHQPDGSSKQYAPLRGADLQFAAPFVLESNKNHSRVYPKLLSGHDFELQLGGGAADPVSVAIFNGKNWDTGDEDPAKRSFNVALDDAKASVIQEIDDAVLAAAKANREAWFPKTPGITDAQIEELYIKGLRRDAYGSSVRAEFQVTGTRAAQCYSLSPDLGHKSPTEVPHSDDQDKPVHWDMLLTVQVYVWIKAGRKRYEQMGIKFAPRRALLIAPGGSSGAGKGGAPLPLQDVAAMPLTIGAFKDGNNGYAHADVTHEAGGTVSFGARDPMVAKMWPPFGESHGDATAINIDFDDGDEALQHLETIEAELVKQLYADPGIFGSGTTKETIEECYVSLVRRDAGRSPTIRFSARNVVMKDAAGEVLQSKPSIPPGAALPQPCLCLPTMAALRLDVKRSGRIETIGLKLAVREAIIDAKTNDDFDGIESRDTKKVRLAA